MSGTPYGLSLYAVMLPVRVSRPPWPTLNVALPAPPVSLKFRSPSVLLPIRVNVALPIMFTLAPAAIWPP